MDNRKHLSAADYPIDLEIGRVEVDALFDSFLIVADIDQSLIMSLVKPIDLVLHVFAQGIDLFFGQPFGVEIAPSSVFDEILVLIRIFPISSP